MAGMSTKPKKGLFIPKNPKKYKGRADRIVYRSSWEKKMMDYIDLNPNVLEWCSEEIWIPYRKPTDNQIHRYFPDFWVKLKTKTGEIKKMILEVKPEYQTVRPQKKKRVTKRLIEETIDYTVNVAKWEAAEEFCKKYGMEFRVVTERDLGLLKKY